MDNWQSTKWETFFLENHRPNAMEILFPDPFLKNQNCAYLWINSPKFYAACFYCMLKWGLSNYIETKLQSTCFYLIQSSLKNKKRSGIFSVIYREILECIKNWFVRPLYQLFVCEIIYFYSKYKRQSSFWDKSYNSVSG